EVDRAAVEASESAMSDEMRGLVKRRVFSDAGSLLALGQEFAALGEAQEAIDSFGSVLEKDPSCWEAFVERANLSCGLLMLRDDAGSDVSLASSACLDLESALCCVDADHRELVLRLLLTAKLVAERFGEAKALGESILRD